ncbi:MAG TPA: helix-turn-helix domain-containing protein [Bacteroidales bacterium]|nr:helix-turn-helix domain-containing protein [Bacteroidales bacterium]HRZ49549.1 helix-turn-helix domain-containing protein [Bacteroidales bacterium]
MAHIYIITKEDVKAAVLEALSESRPTAVNYTPERIIHGLQGLAEFLGIGVTTAWKLKKSGKIPFYSAGKKLFFKESEVLSATQKH